MGLFKIIKYQLYLLQLENYELGRFWKLLFKKGFWPKGEQRKQLVWTMKARAVFLLAVVFHFGLSIILYWVLSNGLSVFSIKYLVLSILIFVLLLTAYCLLLTAALCLLWPMDWLVKQIIIARAKSKIKSLDKLKIIGVAGSYGKTTMKEILKQVLGIRYKVLATPESVNTPVGIARWILKNFDDRIEVAIVEMGEHYVGDIEDLCKITPPDIAVVTGINESHLERMRTMGTIVQTIFEIVSGSKAGATVLLNADDEQVMGHYKEFIWPDHKVESYQATGSRQQVFNVVKLCWEAEFEGIGKVNINLLGQYVLGDVDAAVKIAKQLGMSGEEIKRGIEKIQPVEHRLQPIPSSGNVLVIDDSYNGNPQGAAEAIKVLSRFTNRRKVYITPGLVEIGKASAEIHRQIGKELAGAVDVVVLIKNSVTSYIAEALASTLQTLSPGDGESRREVENQNQPLPNPLQFLERGTNRNLQLYWFNTAQEAHRAIKHIVQPNDVVMFQNDWGDQYI